jgi:predicted O-methyltransferase YrrM
VEMDAQRRLRRRVKTEARSAARELRRDGEIIATERLRAANDDDSRRATKTAQIQSFMERQQHDAKRQTKVIPVGPEGLASAGRKRKKW